MLAGETIVAWASAPGRAPRAVVRISGPGTRDVLRDAIETPPTHRGASRQILRLDDTRTLPVLLLRYIAPSSYTGEDAAEILLPGNPALVDRVVARLTRLDGVRLAGPGEFSARAYLNGKLTLAQAEGVAQAIAADRDDELQTARDLLTGRAGARFDEWTERIASLLALVEAGIDFADQEDVVAISPMDLRERARALSAEIDAHIGAAGGETAWTGLPRVVLVGEPSVGKSTLFNALLGRRRAVTSQTPGTTRDVLEEVMDLSSEHPGLGPVALMDLPGLDANATGTIGEQSQRAAREAIERAHVLVHCDPSGLFRGVSPAPAQTVIRVRTKADLAGLLQDSPHLIAPRGGEVLTRDDRDDPHWLGVCGLDGWGLGALRRALADAAWASAGGSEGGVIPRHRRALRETVSHLRAAGDNAAAAELAAQSLRAALDAVGEITGGASPDAVIGRIFATFCIGK